ncbi:MAG TPA: nucleotide exchange factor GrpE [Clostridia bacterium]|nr:nucleotide exchange factor GrpE [Clostridia bacterium]
MGNTLSGRNGAASVEAAEEKSGTGDVVEPDDVVGSSERPIAEKGAPDEGKATTGADKPSADTQVAEKPEESEISRATQEISRLKEELERKTNEAEENWDRFLRARADAENLRKRIERDLPVMVRREKKDMFLKVLDVMDNFERAMAGAESLSREESDSISGFLKGVEMIYRQMQSILASEGIEPIKACGEAFDPAYHEAVSSEEAEGISYETVVEELQKGYRYQDEVLRPARVRVAVPKDKGSDSLRKVEQ